MGKLASAITLSLGIKSPLLTLPSVNPASLKPKANLANLVQFNWGRGDEDLGFDTVRGYTDWSSDVGIGPNKYISVPPLEVRNFRIHGGTQATPIQIRMPADLPPMDLLARSYPHAPIRVRIGQCDPDDPIDTFREMVIGEITRVNKGRAGRAGIVDVDVSSFKERLNISLGIVADTTCNWIFGDKNCCIDLGPLPVIETHRRCLLINDNVSAATTPSEVINEERIQNVVLFDGEGEVTRRQQVWTDTEALQCLDVDQATGRYIVGMAGVVPAEPELSAFDGITGRRIWFRNITARDHRSIHMIAGTTDFLTGATSGWLERRSQLTGVASYEIQVSGLSNFLEYVADIKDDGTDAFLACYASTGGEAGVKQVDLSDGSLVNDYDDAAITSTPAWNAIELNGTEIFAGGNDMSAPTDINLGKWTKGTPGSADWLVQIGGTNDDVLDIAYYSGSLWVVGPLDTGDNLFEINPATGAVLNQYAVDGGLQLKAIQIDQDSGEAFLLGEANGNRLRVVDLDTAPATVITAMSDELGDWRDVVDCRLFPVELGLRNLREIASVSNQMITFTADLDDPNATGTRFRRGYVELDGIRVMVRDQPALNVVQLNRVPPPEWVPGTKITITPGSDKTIENCRAEWDNEERFGGLGYAIPRYNPMLESS